jgi:hypothetical protein
MKWKVFESYVTCLSPTYFYREILGNWDGVLTEAETFQEAIEIRRQELDKEDAKLLIFTDRKLSAVPETWDLPLNLCYTQPELF